MSLRPMPWVAAAGAQTRGHGAPARLLAGLLCGVLTGLGARAAVALPPPEGLAVSAVTETGCWLSWRAAPDRAKGVDYEVFRNGISAGTTTSPGKRFTSLAPATTHVLTVRARERQGSWSAPSMPLSVTTRPDLAPPTVPGGLAAHRLKRGGLVLTWAASADNVKVTRYEVFRNGASLGSTPVPLQFIRGLPPGTTHVLAVRAGDAAGNWSALCPAVAVAIPADTQPPTVPGDLRALGVSVTRLTLQWAPARDNWQVSGYEVFRDGVSQGIAPGASRILTGLAPATAYGLTVRACDPAGNWSRPSAALRVVTAADTVRPSAPTGLVGSAVGPRGFTLGWAAATDNVGVTRYEVCRSGMPVGTTSACSLALTGLAAGTIHPVSVRAGDAAGNWSAPSAVLTVKTAAADVTPPSVPGGLASSELTATGCTLTWAPASDDLGVTAYEVFRNGVSLGTTTLTTMKVTGPAPGSSYCLTVRAGDAAGHWSDPSPGLEVRFNGVPFNAGFEPEEGYRLGALQDQNGWTVTGAAEIVPSPVYRGRQAVAVPPAAPTSFATRAFARSGPGVVFLDLRALPAVVATPEAGVFLETEATAVALSRAAGAGRLQVFNGDGQGGGAWLTPAAGPVPEVSGRSADWLRLTIRSDYAARRWDLYLDGRMIAADLGFVAEAPAGLAAVTLGGHSTVTTGFDELRVATENPLFADADGDGMEDEWETTGGLDSARDDRQGDRDGDGLSNVREYLLGTDPGQADSDGDGLEDAAEVARGTNPTRADSDGDGMPDGWEVAHGLDPRAAADAAEDADGDGATNLQESADGTNPLDYYDGRAFAIVDAADPAGIAYGYDASGRLARATYPGGWAVYYEHDAASNLTDVAVTDGPIRDWRVAQDLPADGTDEGADDAVVAGDGLPNLAKYAFGLDAHAREPGDIPVVARMLLGGSSYLSLTYLRPDPAPADLRYTVEVSAEGVNWNSAAGATVMVGTTVAGGRATCTVRDATPAGQPILNRRIRLRLERMPLP